MPIIRNEKVVATCHQRLTALEKYAKTQTEMLIHGTPTTPADLTGIYQTCIDIRAALIVKRAELDSLLSARDTAEARRLASDKGLKAWVATHFGTESQEALEFGFSPARIGAKTAETKFRAAEQGKATREARGTRGRRQREKIKGPPIVVTAAPATREPAAAPDGAHVNVPSSNAATAS